MSIYQLERDEDTAELRRLLADSDSPAVRRRAAVALGEVADPGDDAIEALARVARGDPERSVRAGAVDALSEIGEPALRRLCGPEGIDDDEPPVDAYLEFLDHDEPAMRMAAAVAVGSVEAAAAVDGLIDLLDDPHSRVRRRAVRALGKIGDERAVESLARMVPDASNELREEIATALGEIGGERAVSPLSRLAGADDPDVRRRAVVALGRFGSERAVQRLVDRLDDEAESVRRATVFATVESLSNAPPGESHELRSTIVEALNGDHGDVVTATLVELFDESVAAHQRRNAAWLLGRVAVDREVAVETLVAALGDDDETVRRFAATSLAEMGGDVVEETLLNAIDGSVGEHRSMIVFTLGRVGTERSRERLVDLLDETDDVDAQERLLSALSKLGGTGGGTDGIDAEAGR